MVARSLVLRVEVCRSGRRVATSRPSRVSMGRHNHLAPYRDDRLARPLVHLVVPPLHLLDHLQV